MGRSAEGVLTSLERAERAQRAKRAERGEIAKTGEEDGDPRERDDDEVELAPAVLEVGTLMHEEAVSEDLCEQLKREDEEEDPLAHIDEGGLADEGASEREMSRSSRFLLDEEAAEIWAVWHSPLKCQADREATPTPWSRSWPRL